MKHISSKRFLAATLLAGTLTIGWQASPLLAETMTELGSGAEIVNTTSENALSINQRTSVGESRSGSGAILLDNSGNRNTGLTLFTDMDDAVKQPLMRMEVTNPAYDEEVLYIHSDSPTSRGLIRLDSPAPEIEFVETDQEGANGKFEVRVQHDNFQINSRRGDDSTFENKISMNHDGDLTLVGGGVKVESGQVSEFNGGINITGGCIAVDGKCLDGSDFAGGSEPEKDHSTNASVANTGGSQTELASGAPDPIGCNSYTERGAMVFDYEQNRLYVCAGPERGWDYTSLHD